MVRINAILLLALILVGCGDSIGTACNIRGSSFTASHNCSNRCLFYQKIQCPDTSVVTPQYCSGEESCEPGGCMDGQVCYHENDPFEKSSYCIPDNVCGVLSESELHDWEHSTFISAQETRNKQNNRIDKMSPKSVTKPIK